MLTRLLLFVALVTFAPFVSPQEWPQYLGPARNGHAGVSIPHTAKLVEAWRKPLGPGMGAIVVSKGRAFTLFTDDVDDFLIAMDPKTGTELWRARIGKTHADAMNAGPGSTPAVSGDLVIALGSSCRLQAVGAADGKPAWDVDLGSAYKSRFTARGGCFISPLVHRDLVVLPTGAAEGERLAAFDLATGKQAWSAKGVERSINTNPGYRDTSSGTQLLYHYVKSPGTSGVAGVDLKDGSVRWSIEAKEGMSNTAPVPLPGDRVLLQLWSGSTVFEAPEGGTPRHVWSNAELSALPIPAVHFEGHLYGFGGNSAEFFKCVDASTGTARWSTRIYRGAAVLAGRTLVIQSEASGLLRLVAADPAAYRELAKVQVLKPGASTVTPPTIAEGMVFVRNLEELVAVAVR
jgi:outer membrane protein assembly factor BamB